MSRQSALLAMLAAILVVALWWMFLYSPGQDELASIEEEITATEDEAIALRAQVARLEAVRAVAPDIEADLAVLNSIVPTDPALAGALHQFQAAADDAGLTYDQVGTTRPVEVDEASGLHTIGVSLNASGSYFQVVDFLRRVEDPAVVSRGVDVQNVAISPGEYPVLNVTIGATMYALLDPVPDPGAEPAPEEPAEPEDGATPDDSATATDGGDDS